MGRINARTIGYAVVMLAIVVAVAYLMTRVARTETANRRLLTIAAVVVAAVVVGGFATLRFRGRRDTSAEKGDTESG